jgi:hypothetical protein
MWQSPRFRGCNGNIVFILNRSHRASDIDSKLNADYELLFCWLFVMVLVLVMVMALIWFDPSSRLKEEIFF